jgi:ABC-type ATPase involved in cell division
MESAVRDSYRQWDPLAGIPRAPFRLDALSPESPSEFALDLVLCGVRYRYGFQADDEQILGEWAFRYHDNQEQVVFEREGGDIEFGGSPGGQEGNAEVLARLTRPNALFLSLASQVGMPELAPLHEWFTHQLRWGGAMERPLYVPTEPLLRFLDSDSERQRLLDLIRAADGAITEVQVDQDELRSSQRRAIRAARLQMVDQQLSTARELGNDALVRKAERERSRVLHKFPEAEVVRRVRFQHGERGEPFELAEESDGTRSWLALLPDVLAAIDTGAVLVVDELDANLHPQLSVRLITLFQSKEVNPRGAQLLFTTHDASLLRTSFAERALASDQIWFVEKEESGASRLCQGSEYALRGQSSGAEADR